MSAREPDAHLVGLLQRELDGCLDPAEQAELERHLAGSPEAQRYRSRLQQMESLLRSAAAPEAPADLHQRIIEALPPAGQRFRRPSAGTATLAAYGLAAALGGLTVLGLMAALAMPGPDGRLDDALEQMAGTLAPSRHPDPVDEFRIVLSDVHGIATLSVRDGDPWIDVTVDSAESSTVALTLEPGRWHLHAFGRNDDEPGELQVSNGVVRSQGIGRRHFVVWLRPAKNTGNGADREPIGVEVALNGTVVGQGTLAFVPGPVGGRGQRPLPPSRHNDNARSEP